MTTEMTGENFNGNEENYFETEVLTTAAPKEQSQPLSETTITIGDYALLSPSERKSKLAEISKEVKTERVQWTLLDLINKLAKTRPSYVINVNPPYQRQEVWNVQKKKEFIHNLLLGIKLNEFILSKYKTIEGVDFYRVMDGKQRFTSLIWFTKKGLKIDINDAINLVWYNLSYNDILEYNEFDEIFSVNVPMTIHDVSHLPVEKQWFFESETFKETTNNGISLSEAERRSATVSDLNQVTKDIYESFTYKERLYSKSISDNDRYKLREIIEKALYQKIHKDYFSTKITPKVMMKFQNSQIDSDVLNTAKSHLIYCHNIMKNNQTLMNTYWSTKTVKGKTQVVKSGKAAPLFNYDLLIFLMSKMDTTPKEDMSKLFDWTTTWFYKLLEDYRKDVKLGTNTMNVEDRKIFDYYIPLTLKGTSGTSEKRKALFDYIFDKVTTQYNKTKPQTTTV